MIGILVELCISWLILWLTLKKDFSVLGFRPTNKRISDFLFGFLSSAGVCSIVQLANASFSDNSWMVNSRFTLGAFAESSWWSIKSVLFEELIFRGALLYIAIKLIGVTRACILSAICFGVYHWFSYNVIGDAMQMIVVFFMTAVFGLVLAFAFAKTNSLFLPIGFHLGWNLFNIVIFSNGPLGEQFLVRMNDNQPKGILSLLLFIFQVFALPLIAFWYLKKSSERVSI